MAERAFVFVDGNNWYHGLKNVGVSAIATLDYRKIASKLAGPRTWLETRYYVGQLPQAGNQRAYANQRRFASEFLAADARHSIHWGRIESHRAKNEAAIELLAYLASMPQRIDSAVYKDLVALGVKHRDVSVMVEKAVDVNLSIDVVLMAERDAYDTAYVLSADGDYTPAVSFVRSLGKKVFAASCGYGAKLAASVDSYIHLPPSWFTDCY